MAGDNTKGKLFAEIKKNHVHVKKGDQLHVHLPPGKKPKAFQIVVHPTLVDDADNTNGKP